MIIKKFLNVYWLAAIAAIIGLPLAIYAAFFSSYSAATSTLIDHSTLTNSPLIYESPNTKVIIHSPLQIPFDKSISLRLNNFKNTNGSPLQAIFNMKVILPNNRVVFLDNVPKDKTIIAYTNDGCSEIQVTEKYRTNVIQDNEVCWIVSFICSTAPFELKIMEGPKALTNLDSCMQ